MVSMSVIRMGMHRGNAQLRMCLQSPLTQHNQHKPQGLEGVYGIMERLAREREREREIERSSLAKRSHKNPDLVIKLFPSCNQTWEIH